jgi:AraC-like DNA-binding protein
MKHFIPCDILKPYIQSLMVSEADQAQSYTVLPGTSLVMGFQYRGNLAWQQDRTAISLATAGITGILGTFRIFQNTANTGTVLIIFKEATAAHFFKEPLHELYNGSLALDNLVNRAQLSELEEQLSDADSDEERIGLVEQFLLSRMQPRKTDLLVTAAIQQIHHSQGHIRMADLAEKLYTSKSPLEKRFRQVVGTSPKKFATIIRMKTALFTMQSPLTGQNDHQLGFYDQAHFIHDFKKFTGTTPEQYFKDHSGQK